MVIDKEDLWPESFGSTEIETPLEILQKQASFVGGKTGNLLVGDVKKSVDEGGNFVLTFYLVAPALDNYRYKLFNAWHGIGLYPITVPVGQRYKKLETPAEFKHYLRLKFAEDETLNVIRSLMVQSRSG